MENKDNTQSLPNMDSHGSYNPQKKNAFFFSEYLDPFVHIITPTETDLS